MSRSGAEAIGRRSRPGLRSTAYGAIVGHDILPGCTATQPTRNRENWKEQSEVQRLLSTLADVEGAISLWTSVGRKIARGLLGDEFTRAFRKVCLTATLDAVQRAAHVRSLVPPDELDEEEIAEWLQEIFKDEKASKSLAYAVLFPETTIDQAVRDYLIKVWQRFISVTFAVPLDNIIDEYPAAFRERLRKQALSPSSPLASFLGLIELLTLSEEARHNISKAHSGDQDVETTKAVVSLEPGPSHRVSLPTQSEILARFICGRDRVSAHIHTKYEPPFSEELEKAFERLNLRKQAQGDLGYYLGQRFRIIKPPVIAAKGIRLDLTPLNYGFVALMKDEQTDPATKVRIQNILSEVRLPERLLSRDARFRHSYDLLGIEACLLTKDGYTLLRRRGASVLTGRHRWDVSVSGHPTDEDLYNGGLDLARTVNRETSHEIGLLSADERRIQFLGLHRNREYGDIDLCAIWPISNSAKELGSRVATTTSRQRLNSFNTTARARERYVWNTKNIIVEFDGIQIRQALEANGLSLDDMLPESVVCLELALRATGSRPIGIDLD